MVLVAIFIVAFRDWNVTTLARAWIRGFPHFDFASPESSDVVMWFGRA